MGGQLVNRDQLTSEIKTLCDWLPLPVLRKVLEFAQRMAFACKSSADYGEVLMRLARKWAGQQ
jgi:hypothetical protein